MNTMQGTIQAEPQGLPQILLMEDEPSVGKGLQMTLEEEGYGVDWAMTGQSALDSFSRKGFDLLVADLRLPDIDGMAVIKQIKAERPETGVIVITGYSTVPSAVEAMKSGAYDYLPKPFTEEELKAAVEGVLKEKQIAGVKEEPEKGKAEHGGAAGTRKQKAMADEVQVLPRILLIEDEPSVAGGLQTALKEEGYRVDWAMNGQSGLDKVSRNGFDLLVVDIRLPDMDGMEIIRRVKEKRPEIGVVVITGYATVSSAVNAMKLGAYDYLPKPFTEEEFRTTVEGALKQKEEVSVRELLGFFDTEEGKLIQKGEVIRVLNRTGEDYTFWRDLMERGSSALDGYRLSMEAKAALVSGDLKWIRQHVGELTREQLRFIHKRLEREAW